MIVKVCPPAVIELVLWLLFVFKARTYVIVPFPVPLAPDGIVIQEAFGVAFQAHPVPAVIAMVFVTLSDGALVDVGVSV